MPDIIAHMLTFYAAGIVVTLVAIHLFIRHFISNE